MKKVKSLALSCGVGFLGGYVTCTCVTKFLTRPTNPGGEILVIPLIFLSICLYEELKGGVKAYDKTKKVTKEAKQNDIAL